MDTYKKMEELGITLPKAPAKGGTYAQIKKFGRNLVYVSGCGPITDDETYKGKLGKPYSVEEGQKAARSCMLNILAILHANIGDLNKIKNVVKILTFVAGEDDFYDQPKVANGGTNLLIDLLGEQIGAPSRSAIGVNALPGNVPVETEAIFEIED
jgi:enamine deaminase RidA (YjgF/YER057c/UK114 family)